MAQPTCKWPSPLANGPAQLLSSRAHTYAPSGALSPVPHSPCAALCSTPSSPLRTPPLLHPLAPSPPDHQASPPTGPCPMGRRHRQTRAPLPSDPSPATPAAVRASRTAPARSPAPAPHLHAGRIHATPDGPLPNPHVGGSLVPSPVVGRRPVVQEAAGGEG